MNSPFDPGDDEKNEHSCCVTQCSKHFVPHSELLRSAEHSFTAARTQQTFHKLNSIYHIQNQKPVIGGVLEVFFLPKSIARVYQPSCFKSFRTAQSVKHLVVCRVYLSAFLFANSEVPL